MKIRLNEIPQDGREYVFDRKSGELNGALADILGTHPYDVKFTIKPIGNAYELRGKVATTLTETCSKCGWEFDMPVSRALNEILFEEQEEYRKAHSVHGNRSVDYGTTDLEMSAYRGEVFDAANFVHEAIALAEPFYPTCGKKDGACDREAEVRKIREQLEAEYASAEEEAAIMRNPFAVLKGLDLGKKN